MNFYILTLFPQMVEEGLNTSIIGRASEAGVLHIEAVDIRAYSANKHHKVDDYPYGGGAGMLMQAQPVYDAWKAVADRIGKKPRCIYVTPQGGGNRHGLPVCGGLCPHGRRASGDGDGRRYFQDGSRRAE